MKQPISKPIPDIQAVLFDMDGTLIDTETLYIQATRQALADLDCHLTVEETVTMIYGQSWRDVYEQVKARFKDNCPPYDAMLAGIQHYFTQMSAETDLVIPTSVELLKKLARNYPVAIVSGSMRQDIGEAIQLMQIGSLVRFYLGAEDYHPGKPHPACYRAAADRFGLTPEHFLVFEDSTVGVTAAKEAGMYCVGLQRNGFPPQDMQRADMVLSDLSEFDVTFLSR